MFLNYDVFASAARTPRRPFAHATKEEWKELLIQP